MKYLKWKRKDFKKKLKALFDRNAYPPEIESGVKEIIDAVRSRGDAALSMFAKKFDSVKLSPKAFKVSRKEIRAASEGLDPKIKSAIAHAISNVTVFSERRIPRPWTFSPRLGVILGERFEPFDRVGIYVPGGSAPLVSTAIHTTTIAKVAGVGQIVAATPPNRKGEIHPALLYALDMAGATEIYKLGGAYAVAGMALGTKTVRKVQKIVGPGNQYVTAAKKLVFGEVSIDMVAGPSEIMIIADSGKNPEFIAADMLSQAEHGSGYEQSILLSDDPGLIEDTASAIRKMVKNLTRTPGLDRVLKNGIFLIEVRNLDQAAEIASQYAPEHLEIICSQPGSIAKKVKAAGAIFLGEWTPECVGDFMAGPSHVLPTGGAAKHFSGLRVEDFFRRISIVSYQKSSLESEACDISCFAETEGLKAHGLSASVRTGKVK